MNPWFLTGFMDAVSILNNNKYISKWEIKYVFSIGHHKKIYYPLRKYTIYFRCPAELGFKNFTSFFLLSDL
jgi:hypothetical protein